MQATINYSVSLKMFSGVISNQGWILYSSAAQQITKADRNACHAICRTERSELMSLRR